MSTHEETRVDVSRIMADIQREIDEKGLFDELPAFDQVVMVDLHISENADTDALRQCIQRANGFSHIPADYPVVGGFLKRAFKKASQKATRCSIGPMSIQISEAHASMIQCFEMTLSIIEQQQKQIDEMKEKLQLYGKRLNGEEEE